MTRHHWACIEKVRRRVSFYLNFCTQTAFS